jgi:hypothetical protein
MQVITTSTRHCQNKIGFIKVMWVWNAMTKITLDHLYGDLWELIMFDSRWEYDFGKLFVNVSNNVFSHPIYFIFSQVWASKVKRVTKMF